MKGMATFLAISIILAEVVIIANSSDTTPPSINDVKAVPSSIIQGENLTIKCNVTDNVAVGIVKAVIKYPDNSTVNMTMKKGEENEYYYTARYTIVGTYIFHIWANDTSGNSNISSNYTFYVEKDTYPPTTKCYLYGKMGNNSWYVGDVKVVLIANDTGMDHINTYYKLDNEPLSLYLGSFTVSKDGIHDLYYYSIDIVGNKENAKHTTFKIDKTAPTTTCQISGYKGNDGWYLTIVNITLLPYDNASGINQTFYKINNESWQIYNKTFSIMDDGIYNLSYYSIDNAGNKEKVKTKVIKIDKTSPLISFLKPVQGYLYIADRQIMPTLFGNTIIIGKITVIVDATNHGSGISKVEFYVDGNLKATLTQSPYIWQWNYASIGTHLLKVVAYDNAGNYAGKEMIVKTFIP